MPRINEHYLNLQASYLFAEVKRRTQAFREIHPDARVISLGIGDVTRPLPPAVVHALEEASREQGRAETLRGYGPYVGYEFLRAEIAAHDFGSRGVDVTVDEIFISDGGKSDSANLQEIFAIECVVALMDPVYPVYADSNVIAGHYARAHEATILYDAAYAAYIRDADVPHSIYEIAGAREVAIECRSFSKSAGFTGLRLAYTVVPKEAQGRTARGEAVSLNTLWLRRTSTKSNGAPYIVQKAAAAVYTPDGQKQVRKLIDYYMENAEIIRDGLTAAGLTVYGGSNAPYLWVRTP